MQGVRAPVIEIELQGILQIEMSQIAQIKEERWHTLSEREFYPRV
jgi:hypothetical protein